MFSKKLKLLLIVIGFFILNISANAQITIDRFSFFTNYNGIRIPNGFNDNLEEGFAYNGGMELQMSRNLSFTLYRFNDYDGYSQLRPPIWGSPLSYYDVRVPWATRYNETYGMFRLYTESNYYSKSYDLRNKDLYGIYFALGYSYQTFTGRYWAGEQFVYEYIDDNGDTEFRIDTYIDISEVTIIDWSTQFGAGFKNFHSKYLYSDIMLSSSAYRRDNRRVKSAIYPDSRRNDNNDPLVMDQEENERYTEVWAKNGRGILLNICIGINLDVKK